MENSYTGNTGLLWRSTAFQYQCVYDPQHFLNQGIDYAIEITRLRFRPLNGTIDAGGQLYAGVTIVMSTSQLDSQTMDVTFANNTGADAVTVYAGDVTLLPVTGTTPNDHHIDITLQTPFIYNPSNGPLLVDVAAPNAPTAAVPNMAASNNYLTQFARRNSTATVGSATGALSGFAAAMKMDYAPLPGTAQRATYGNACYERPRMVYEQFVAGATPDLIGTDQALIFQTSAVGGNYIIIPGSSPYSPVGPGAVDLLTFPWTSTSVAAPGSWDDASIVMTPATLAGGFPYPNAAGATVTDITINSNGRVYLGATTDATFATNGAPYAGLGPFQGLTGAGLANLAVFNVDLDPTTGGNMWYEDPSPNGGVRITWDNIFNWQDATFTGQAAGANFMQMELFPDGRVTMAYGSALTTGGSAANDGLVGFSAGGGEPITTMVDWSAITGLQTGDGLVPVTLAVDARPVLGTTVNLITSGIPSGAFGTISILSVGTIQPGIDLGIIGMPGCDANVDIVNAVLDFVVGSPTATRAFALPATPALSGQTAYSQSLVVAAGVNPLGGLTTNGVALLLGTL